MILRRVLLQMGWVVRKVVYEFLGFLFFLVGLLCLMYI